MSVNVSICYTETQQYADLLVDREIARMRLDPINNPIGQKPTADQLLAVRRSIDTYAIRQRDRSHYLKLPFTIQQLLAKKCTAVRNIIDLETALRPKAILKTSPMAVCAKDLVKAIQEPSQVSSAEGDRTESDAGSETTIENLDSEADIDITAPGSETPARSANPGIYSCPSQVAPQCLAQLA